MTERQLDRIVGLLEKLVDQTRTPKTEYKVEVHSAGLDVEKVAEKASDAYYRGVSVRQDYGKKVPVRGAVKIAAKDVVPDLDAISVDGGKTYNMVVDTQYLEKGMVELTTDAGYTIRTNGDFAHTFRSEPSSYGE